METQSAPVCCLSLVFLVFSLEQEESMETALAWMRVQEQIISDFGPYLNSQVPAQSFDSGLVLLLLELQLLYG